MNNTQISKVKINEGIVWRVIDDEVVVLSPLNVSMHALTGCGSRIWELIEQESEGPAIIATICREYEVEPDQAEKEIIGFIQGLAEHGMIEISSSVPKEGAAI